MSERSVRHGLGLLLGVLVLPACAQAPKVPATWRMTCPPAVRLADARVLAVAGAAGLDAWKPSVDDGPVALSGVNLFDGPPAEGAQLMPERSSADGLVSTWTFSGPGATQRHVSCDYAQGLVRLHALVPESSSTCTATAQRQRPQGTLSAAFSCR
jgi:hypothetical protein